MGQGSQVLGRVLAHDRRALVLSSLLVAGHQLSEAAVPVVVGGVLDSAPGPGDTGALLVGALAVAAVFVVLAACAVAGYWLALRQERDAANVLRVAVAARVLAPGGGAPGVPAEQVALASGDADRAALVCRAVASAAGAVAALVGGTVVLLHASAVLGAVVLPGVAVVLVGARLLAGPLAGRAAAEQEALTATTSTVTRLLSGLRPLKGVGAERAAGAAYRAASRQALDARLRSSRAVAGYEAASGLLSALLLAAVALVGGDLARKGEVTVGQLVAALGLAQFLLGPLDRLVRTVELVATARGSAARLAALLDAPPAVHGGRSAPATGPGTLALLLPDGDTVHVAAGEHLGLVVPDPREAAELLAVLARDSDAGPRVLLDGVDLRELTLDAARGRLLVGRHDAVLLEVTAGQAAADPDGRAAARADEVLDALPHGPATPLDDGGRRLSGGQRQRLVLARALAAAPCVLVLDEPTTALDAVTEDAVADGVARLRAGRTTVLVTASPALLSRCDRVVLLDGGEVLTQGRHDQLVQHPRYRDVTA